MLLDELLDERQLFISHEVALAVAMDTIGPLAAPSDPIALLMHISQKSALSVWAVRKVLAMREAGVL